jgi:hypothetical protein
MNIRPAMASLLRRKRRHASRHNPRDVRGGTYTGVVSVDGRPTATLVVVADVALVVTRHYR